MRPCAHMGWWVEDPAAPVESRRQTAVEAGIGTKHWCFQLLWSEKWGESNSLEPCEDASFGDKRTWLLDSLVRGRTQPM